MDADEIAARIENFVRDQFDVHDEDPRFDRSADLFEQGYVDSVGVVELLAFLQGVFGIEIPESDLTSDAFTSIDGIASVVARLLGSSVT